MPEISAARIFSTGHYSQERCGHFGIAKLFLANQIIAAENVKFFQPFTGRPLPPAGQQHRSIFEFLHQTVGDPSAGPPAPALFPSGP